LRVVQQNGWTCSICQDNGDSRFDFKKHIFFSHSDQDVQKFYQRSWRDLLQLTWINRIRQQQLSNIKLGRFDSHCRYFAQGKSKLDYHALDLSNPVFLEKDAEALDMRFKLCKIKM